MDRWVGKVALVTGASVGIGAAISEQLVSHGLQVVGIARRYDLLKKLGTKLVNKKGRFHPLRGDVTKEDEILALFNWIRVNFGALHVLINNAGIIKKNTLIDGDTNDWRDVLDTNVLGLCICTREAVKIMRHYDVSGHIIHINSISGQIVPDFPYFNIYPASKHAVTALAETLRQELLNTTSTGNNKIKVSSISPGLVDAEMLETSNIELEEDVLKRLKDMKFLQCEDVADAVVYVLSTPENVQIQELKIKPIGEVF